MSLRIGLTSLIVLLAAIAPGRAQPPAAGPEKTAQADSATAAAGATNQQIQSLIEQLGSTRFQEREQASARLLEIGQPALIALSAAQRGTDIEIGQRAQAIRQRIEQEHFESVSLNFKRDPDPTASYGLPGWKSFSMVAGTSRPAKRLFLEMLERRRIVAFCLEALDGGEVPEGLFDGWPEDPQARLRAVVGKTCADIRLDLTSGRDEAHAGDLIALLVAEHRLTQPLQDVHEAIRMECTRGGLDQLMRMPGTATAARKTIGGWFQRAPVVYSGEIFVWSTLFRIPESKHMARRVLEAKLEPELMARSLFILSNFGTVEDLPLIDSFVSDPALVDEFIPSALGEVRFDLQAPPNGQRPNAPTDEGRYTQTVGDVAMAAGGKLAGLDLHALFPAIVIEDVVGIHRNSVGFPKKEPQLRTKAVESYKAQRAKSNPPPAS